ncbi:PKD domain-containing protein, partial [Candidatus Thiomargarita nelsonii]
DSLPDTVVVTVENVNHAPEANAGEDQTVDENSEVTLDGTESSDPDNDELTCHWEQIGGIPVDLSNNDDCITTFMAPSISSDMEELPFRLTVTDEWDSSDADEVVIHVQDTNAPPACELAVAEPELIWPPNHKMVPIEILNVTDPDEDQLFLEITEVTQDEDVNGLGDGDTSPDAVLTDNGQL